RCRECIQPAGEAEVEDLHLTGGGNEDVFRFEIAGNNSFLGPRTPPAGNLPPVVECLADRDPHARATARLALSAGSRSRRWCLSELLSKRHAIEELGNRVGCTLLLPEVENGKGVGWGERRTPLGFGFEPWRA